MGSCSACGSELMKHQQKYCSRKCYHSSPKSAEMRQRVSAAGRGRKQNAETKEKRASKLRGQKRPEHGVKVSMALKGRPLTEAHRKAISKAKLESDAARGPNAYQWNPDRNEQRMKFARSRACYSFVGRMLGWIEAGSRDLSAVIPQLGYSGLEFCARMEGLFSDGMSWENFGVAGWHVDHIRPISSFPLGTPLAVVNALENLRPLWARENLSKGAKWQP